MLGELQELAERMACTAVDAQKDHPIGFRRYVTNTWGWCWIVLGLGLGVGLGGGELALGRVAFLPSFYDTPDDEVARSRHKG